ncbi:BLUF domain-containing protein [Asticcacaulis benevestitus]|uniref:BLUF domain-containing protein n=1 Tax=Asticcacaulis benevestitus TaxID=347481 RepID=UPI003CC7C549
MRLTRASRSFQPGHSDSRPQVKGYRKEGRNVTRLIQLIYVSRFVAGNRGMLSEMRNILTVSRANNYHNQLTGCLLFDREIFVRS